MQIVITDKEKKVLIKMFKVAALILEEAGGDWEIDDYDTLFTANDLFDLAEKLGVEY